MEGGSKSTFPSGMLSPFQCVRAWKFYMDRRKADGSSASVSRGKRFCARGCDTGIPGCPGLDKQEILFPDNVTICCSVLEIAILVFVQLLTPDCKGFPRNLHFKMEFLLKLWLFLGRKSEKNPIRREEKGGI